MSFLVELLNVLLDLAGYALSAKFYAIVGKTSGVALCDEDMKLVFGVLLAERRAEVVQM